MKVSGHTALVTGANRGIGREFVLELLERGATKVYATSRRPEVIDVDDSRVVALRLDLLDSASIAEAAAAATDVSLLVNNAGISTATPLLTGQLDAIRREMDTHFWGTLQVTRAFAPILAANGGGAVVNILSALSWFTTPGHGAYGAAKAAEWNLTNGVRQDLAAQQTLVQGVHLGAAATAMMGEYEGPMLHPRDVARASLDGLADGRIEVVADDWSAMVKSSLAADPATFYDQLAGRLAV